MIHLEILETPDHNVKTSFQYFQNMLYLGSTSGDLQIHDAELKPSHLMLEVLENQLLVHPQRDVKFFLINGKRATSIRKIKSGDTLTIGRTLIKILHFEWTEFKTRKDVLNAKLAVLLETKSPRLAVIEQLSKLAK